MPDGYLEWYVESEFVQSMEDLGLLCLKGDRIKRGWPDHFVFMPGPRTLVIEFKRDGASKRRGEKLQDHYRKRFEDMNYEVFKITGKEEADVLRDRIIEELGES